VVWDHLGDVYLRLGESAKARATWDKGAGLFDAGRSAAARIIQAIKAKLKARACRLGATTRRDLSSSLASVGVGPRAGRPDHIGPARLAGAYQRDEGKATQRIMKEDMSGISTGRRSSTRRRHRRERGKLSASEAGPSSSRPGTRLRQMNLKLQHAIDKARGEHAEGQH
jgi:hypothetical protein